MLEGQDGEQSARTRARTQSLRRLLAANTSVDFRTVALDASSVLTPIELCDLAPSEAMPLLQAFQRVVRILPRAHDQHALTLIESGLHSAVQIATLSPPEFERRWAELFPGEEQLGSLVYRAALTRRSELLLHHINKTQSQEPHYRAARFK